jgi:hypothetical protein
LDSPTNGPARPLEFFTGNPSSRSGAPAGGKGRSAAPGERPVDDLSTCRARSSSVAWALLAPSSRSGQAALDASSRARRTPFRLSCCEAHPSERCECATECEHHARPAQRQNPVANQTARHQCDAEPAAPRTSLPREFSVDKAAENRQTLVRAKRVNRSEQDLRKRSSVVATQAERETSSSQNPYQHH